ncbi:ANTAR domain-containing response regulator [Halomonas sp. WWR20]
MTRQDFHTQLLLIDCEERTQGMLQKCLDRLGLRALTVADNADVALDEINGVIVELDHFNSERLLATVRTHGLPIVAVTHHQTLSQIQRAIRLGATAILNKPITQSTVYTTLMMARGLNDKLQQAATVNRELTATLAQRDVIAKAVAHLMVKLELDEQEAYERLRSHAMTTRQTLEQVCLALLEPASIFARRGSAKP